MDSFIISFLSKDGALQSLYDEFGYLPIDQITVREWTRFINACRHKNPKMNFENHWKHMNYVMSYAQKCKLLKDIWLVENPSPSNQIGRVITAAEKEALFRVATPILKDQMLFAATMGMRLREHLQLSWDTSYCCHVDLSARTVTVCAQHSKTHKGRTIPLSSEVFEMLERRSKFEYWHKGYLKRKVQPSQWVFQVRWITRSLSLTIVQHGRVQRKKPISRVDCAIMIGAILASEAEESTNGEGEYCHHLRLCRFINPNVSEKLFASK